jgi:hypothetical protein
MKGTLTRAIRRLADLIPGCRARGSRTTLLVLTGIVVALAPAIGRGANEAIYAFVDEHGVVHLSNVPLDKRYRPLTAETLRQAQPEEPAEASPPDDFARTDELPPMPPSEPESMPAPPVDVSPTER